MPVLSSIFNFFGTSRLEEIDYFCQNPIEVQEKTFKYLIEQAKNTEFGKKFNFNQISNVEQFQNLVPIHTYEELKPYIDKILKGENNILWNTETKWFAKSSGTTSSRSKYIPITKESLEDCHFRSGKDIILLYHRINPDTNMLKGKTFALGGSTSINQFNSRTYYGDLSAVLIKNLPFWTFFHRVPRPEISLIEDWEIKMGQLIESTKNKDITSIVGVPSWFLVFLKELMNETGADNILEIWPNLELFIHGGISFEPYRKTYEQIIPSSKMCYLETYNASEGFFGIQESLTNKELLLMLDYGIYYEFIPMKDFHSDKSNAIPLSDVKIGVDYAIIISTNGGLWRYIIGDTVKFTSTNPYKLIITGRTQHFINAFGEELVINNAQRAILKASEVTNAEIKDYTAAPIFMDKNSKGRHQWLFEFVKHPSSIEKFTEVLDNTLKDLNSDYEAKRYKDINLDKPEIIVLKDSCFYLWLKQKGKVGGQNKVPRLSNSREFVEELLVVNKQL